MRDHQLYLKDILAAIDQIETFVQGMDQEAFKADDKTLSAVIRKLEIIGEAAKGVPEEFDQAIPIFPGERWQGCVTN